VCARAEQKLSRGRERARESEREREMCARAGKARPRARKGSTGDSRRLNKVWSLFLVEKSH